MEEYLSMARLANETHLWNRTRGRVVDYTAISNPRQNNDKIPSPGPATLQEQVQEIKAFYKLHGKSPTGNMDVRLSDLCSKFRQARKNPEKHESFLTDALTKELDSFNFVWDASVVPRKPEMILEERIQELREYWETYDEFPRYSYRLSYNQSYTKLSQFCRDLRAARKTPEKAKFSLSEDHIASLDSFGFQWEKTSPDALWLDRFRAYQAEHGNLVITHKTSLRLYTQCLRIRRRRKEPSRENGPALNDQFIKELDNLGFQW